MPAEGVDLDRSTLARWVGEASELMEPLVEALRRYVMNTDKLHGDDTPLPVLAPGNGRPRRHAFGPMCATTARQVTRRLRRVVHLLARSQRRTSTASSGEVPRHPASGRLRRLCCERDYVAKPTIVQVGLRIGVRIQHIISFFVSERFQERHQRWVLRQVWLAFLW